MDYRLEVLWVDCWCRSEAGGGNYCAIVTSPVTPRCLPGTADATFQGRLVSNPTHLLTIPLLHFLRIHSQYFWKLWFSSWILCLYYTYTLFYMKRSWVDLSIYHYLHCSVINEKVHNDLPTDSSIMAPTSRIVRKLRTL